MACDQSLKHTTILWTKQYEVIKQWQYKSTPVICMRVLEQQESIHHGHKNQSVCFMLYVRALIVTISFRYLLKYWAFWFEAAEFEACWLNTVLMNSPLLVWLPCGKTLLLFQVFIQRIVTFACSNLVNWKRTIHYLYLLRTNFYHKMKLTKKTILLFSSAHWLQMLGK